MLHSGIEVSQVFSKMFSFRPYLLAVLMMLHCGAHVARLGSRSGPADLSSLVVAGCSGQGCLPFSQDYPEWQDSPLLAPSSSTPPEELQSAKTSLRNNKFYIENSYLSLCVCGVHLSNWTWPLNNKLYLIVNFLWSAVVTVKQSRTRERVRDYSSDRASERTTEHKLP